MKSDSEMNEAASKLFKQLEISEPDIFCPSSGIRINRLCVEQNCQETAFMCSCEHCQTTHFNCKFVSFKSMTRSINQLVKKKQEFIKQICSIQDSFIYKIQQSREYILANANIGLQKKIMPLAQQLYQEKEDYHLTGREAAILQKAIKKTHAIIREQEQEKVREYKQTLQKIVNNLIEVKQEFYNSFLSKPHVKKLDSVIERQIIKNKQSIQEKSELIREEIFEIRKETLIQQLTKEQKDFLLDALFNPKRIQLLYRGSQHHFRAQIFHDMCDNINDTLTIVHTEYDKLIGGFTHYAWNERCNDYVQDKQMNSFMFSLTLQKKYLPENDAALIMCYNGMGPTFGCGYDLCIVDKCDTSKGSYARFPTAYKLSSKIQKKSKQKICEQTAKDFSGSSKEQEYHFKVTEYEVYRVVYE